MFSGCLVSAGTGLRWSGPFAGIKMGLVEPIRALAGVCLSMCTCVYLSAGSAGKEVRRGCRAPHVMGTCRDRREVLSL